MRYRRKPVVVEAVQWNVERRLDEMPDWFHAALSEGRIDMAGEGMLYIETLEGVTTTAQANDWIIRGAQGEIYPCRPEIFAATYDPMEPAELEAEVVRLTVIIHQSRVAALRAFGDGDAIGYLMNLLGTGFPETVKLMGEHISRPVTRR